MPNGGTTETGSMDDFFNEIMEDDSHQPTATSGNGSRLNAATMSDLNVAQ